MRVLLDECVDWRLDRELAPDEVKTASLNGMDNAQEWRVARAGANAVRRIRDSGSMMSSRFLP